MSNGTNVTAYIGNLPYDAGNDDVIDLFHPIPVQDVRLIRDRDGDKMKGYGFVEFTTAADLEEAVAKNGEDYRGRRLTVQRCKNPPRARGTGEEGGREGGRGGGRGFRRGGGGGDDRRSGGRDYDRDGDRYGRGGGGDRFRDGGDDDFRRGDRFARGGRGDEQYGGRAEDDRYADRGRADYGRGERSFERRPYERPASPEYRHREPMDGGRYGGGSAGREQYGGGSAGREQYGGGRGYGGDRDGDRGYGGDRDNGRSYGGDRDSGYSQARSDERQRSSGYGVAGQSSFDRRDFY